ncbi:hypothetical protein FQR65_LT03349 [Abscondita terminalis]|nr:hypothetical protein FQR65_LT03349 [Abscondita terminalis]
MSIFYRDSQNHIRHSFTLNLKTRNLNNLAYVIDISCTNATDLLNESKKLNRFQSHYKWIIFDSQGTTLRDSTFINKALNNVQFRIDSEVSILITDSNRSKVLIYDIYSVQTIGYKKLAMVEIGFWTLSSKLNLTYQESKYVQRKNLTGSFLKIGTVRSQTSNDSLDTEYRNRAKKNSDNLNKLNYMFFIHFQEIHNFRTCFIFRKPRSSGRINNEFLKPFVYSLWYLILATIVAFCIFLNILFFVERKIFGDNEENSWHTAWILTIGVLCQQGASFVPRPTSGRCILLSMLLMSLLLYNYYTSSIVSSLLSSSSTSIKTIRELTESELTVGVEDTPYTKMWFKITNDSDHISFYNKKVLVNNIPSYLPINEGLKRVKSGSYAYHTEANTAYTKIPTAFEPYQICELGEVNLVPPQTLWLLSQKNSEYTKIIQIGYNQMLQTGIMSRQKSIWISKKPACLASTYLDEVAEIFFFNVVNMKLVICIGFLSLAFANSSANLNLMEGIISILVQKNVKHAYLCTCMNISDKIGISRLFSQNYIRHSFTINLESSNLNNLAYVIDISCTNSTNLLEKSKELNRFQSNYKWILFDSQGTILRDSTFIDKALNNVQFRIDSDVSILVTDRNTTKILIYDVYSVEKNGYKKLEMVEMGFWTLSTKLNVTYQKSKYVQRKNLTGTFLKIGTVRTQTSNDNLDSEYRNRAKKDSDNLNKLNYMLFLHLQEIHNFTYNMSVANMWAGNEIGGVDDGLGKLLYEKKVDIGATSASIRSDRIKFYDFVFPTYPFKYKLERYKTFFIVFFCRTCFIFRTPRSSGQINNEFLKPFVYSLWYLILATTVVFCVFLKFLFFVEHKIFGVNEENSWHTAWIMTVGVLCQQGASFVPKPTSGRCTLLSMLLMSLLLYNYYTSSIVSSLLSSSSTPIKTIRELTESQLTVGLEDTPYTRVWFKIQNDTDLNTFYNKKVLINNIPSYVPVNEGLNRVKSGSYAYHTEANTGYTTISTTFEPYQICELGEVNLLPPQILWLFSQKNSEYTKIVQVGYNKMLQSGIMSRQKSIWVTKKPTCLANTYIVEVGMGHLLPAFVVLCFGGGLALFVLIAEVIMRKKISY